MRPKNLIERLKREKYDWTVQLKGWKVIVDVTVNQKTRRFQKRRKPENSITWQILDWAKHFPMVKSLLDADKHERIIEWIRAMIPSLSELTKIEGMIIQILHITNESCFEIKENDEDCNKERNKLFYMVLKNLRSYGTIIFNIGIGVLYNKMNTLKLTVCNMIRYWG